MAKKLPDWESDVSGGTQKLPNGERGAREREEIVLISGPLLNKVYEMTKTQLDRMLPGLETINVITDESSNIQSSKIYNISVLMPSSSVHYVSEDIQAKQMNATAAAQWL